MSVLSTAAQVKLFVVCVCGMLNGGGVVPVLTRAVQVKSHCHCWCTGLKQQQYFSHVDNFKI